MLHRVREPHVVEIKHILQTCALYSRQHNSCCLAVLFYELNPSILLVTHLNPVKLIKQLSSARSLFLH